LIYAVVNQKGGVGKTTTAVNLAAAFAAKGRRVLLIDSDPQGNATSGLGIDRSRLEACIYNVLLGDKTLEDVKVAAQIDGLELVPATLNLAGAEVELVSAISRESRLRSAIHDLDADSKYDFVIIDAPPSLGLITINALTAGPNALIPIQCEYYALEGISQLLSTVDLVRRHLNHELHLEKVILTMHDRRLKLSQQVIEEVRRYFGDKVARTVIPRNVRLSEAPSHGLPINLYDPECKGARSYMALAEELLEERTEAAFGQGA
jgi:chromosome partitioning protein